jgi:pimeloyl-ACP methyl ester carboxylesterase
MTPPSLTQSLHDCIPDSQFHLIERAGHNVLLEQPQVVADYLDRFITQLSISGGL